MMINERDIILVDTAPPEWIAENKKTVQSLYDRIAELESELVSVTKLAIYSADKIEQLEAENARLRTGKPDWKDAPEWAEWLAQDESGEWWWHENIPESRTTWWYPETGRSLPILPENPKWQSTLERRPSENINP